MNQGDASSDQFAAKAYRTAALSRPMYSRAYRQLALNLHQDRPNHTTVLLEHAAQLAPNQFVNWMALAEVYTQQQACPALGGMEEEQQISKWRPSAHLDGRSPPCFPAEASKMPHKSFGQASQDRNQKWHVAWSKWTLDSGKVDDG